MTSKWSKLRVLSHLLEENLTTKELADRCGYANRSNPYGLICQTIKELEREGYIYSKSVRRGRGRPPTLHSVNKDLTTLRRIYRNYPELSEKLREQEWVLELMLDELDVEDVREEVKEMLRLSPTFFEMCIEQSSVSKVAYIWFHFINLNILSKHELEEEAGIYGIIFPQALHKLFLLCVFLDYMKGRATEKSFNFLRKLAERMKEEEMRSQARWTLIEVLSALKAFYDLLKQRKEGKVLHVLSRYLVVRDQLTGLDRLDPEVEVKLRILTQEMDELCNEVAAILGLKTKIKI